MENLPKISVVIVTYQFGAYLRECIESLLAQTLRPFEIVIYDDCSTDDSRDIMEEYRRKYPDLFVIHNQPENVGMHANANMALRRATGDLVSLLDGDDRWLPRKLELEWKALTRQPGAEIAYSNVITTDASGQRTGIWYDGDGPEPPSGDVFIQTFSKRFFPEVRSLFRNPLVSRAALEAMDYHDEAIELFIDWDLKVRLTAAYPVAYSGEALVEYRVHAGGIHNQPLDTYLRDLFAIYRKNRPLLEARSAEERAFVESELSNLSASYGGPPVCNAATTPEPLSQQDKQAALLNADGEQAYANGDMALAETCFTRANRLAPDNTEILNNLVVLCWKQGDAAQSLDYLAKGLSINGFDRDLIINGGQILVEVGQADVAKQLYAGYLGQAPDDADVIALLSAASGDTGDAGEPAGQGVEPCITGEAPGAGGNKVASGFDRQGSNLIFILSLPRSGSTLLQQMLGGHSQIHTVTEPWLMLHPLYALRGQGIDAEYDADLARKGLEDFLGGLDGGGGIHLDAVRAYATELYGAALRQSGKTFFLDKTPRYHLVLPELRACFPKAKFVFLLRNPAAVLSSTLRTWFDNDAGRLHGTSNYRDLTDGARHLADALDTFGEQAVVVRYEDLVSDPQQTLDTLCQSLGIDFETQTLSYGDVSGTRGRHGDQTHIHEHDRAVSEYRDAWIRNLRDSQRKQYALDYLDTLGTQTIGRLGYDADAIRAALQGGTGERGYSDADRVNAEGEALFQAGDTAGALAKFEQALLLDENFILAYSNLAVLHWRLQDPGAAIKALSDGFSRQPHNRDLIITAGEIFSALGMKADALSLLEGYLAQSPADPEIEALRAQLLQDDTAIPSGEPAPVDETAITAIPPVQAASGEDAAINAPDDEPIVVMTSIAPSRIDVQQRAVQSWLELGLEVMSLNVQEEIDCLKTCFPGVTFVPAPRNGRKRLGKPYVYVNDMFAALRETGRETVGIINSDIILRADADLLALIRRESKDSLLYGSRIDIDSPDDENGRYYRRGFDLFFMGRDVTNVIPGNNFMLGMPWWDYWLPCLMLLKGIEIKRIENPRAFHLAHTANYSADHMQEFSQAFAGFFPSEPFMDYYRQSRKSNFSEYSVFVLSDCVLDHVARNSSRIDVAGERAGSRDGQASRPKVTALVSTYASEAFIGECLDDLVNQTIADQIEVIVIDAASPQDERAVVERYQARYPNIRYHRTPERIGIYEAWNIAARMATGEYLISCSTNDRLRNDACEILARTLDDQPEVALAYGYTYLTRTPHQPFDRATLFSLYVWKDYDYEAMLESCMVGPHPMWRRSLHDTVGYFDESLAALGDQDFWLRVGREHTMKVIPDFTGLYLVSSDSLTGDSERNRIEEDRIRAKWGLRHRYGKWFNKRLAVQESVRCSEGPKVQVVVQAADTDLSAVADTLDTLSGQAYPNWALAVVSNTPCPDPLFRDHPQLAWIDKDSGDALDDDAGYLLFMKAGERLDPLFLSDACAAFAQHPEWQSLYFDDDRVAADGELQDPRFKPDFNLDLLRSTDYIGNACLFRATAVSTVAEDAIVDCRAFDLVLRIHDHYGRQAVGHLAEPRFHCLQDVDGDASELAQRRQALQAHLLRCKEPAVIEAGALPGSFMLSYASETHPKVSILLVAREPSGTVVEVVRGVLEKTDYPDYEIRVLVDPAVPAAVGPALEALSTANVVVHQARNSRPVSAVDLGRLAGEAQGEFLLWLNDNTHVLQDAWLSRLVANGLRKGVGATAPRLINKDKILLGAGVMPGVGKRGAGARMHGGLHMTSDGYMGRAQLAQETGAAQALCLLVKKSLFRQAGGFDKALAIDLYRDIDFCERLRAAGLQVVWTPHVTLMHLGAINAIDGVPASEAQARKEVDILQQRWLGQFAREAAYNRNLSLLRSDYAIETGIAPVWNHEPGEAPRILSFGVGSYGSWQYRVRQPLDVMQGAGLIQCAHTDLAGKKSVLLPTVVELERLQPTSLLMHNTSHDDYIAAMEDYKRVNNAFIVFGQDDLITALPSKNPFSKTVYRDMKQRMRKCLSIADRLVVTTEPLADALRGMADDVWVVPNYLDAGIWGELVSQRRRSDKPRVGWAGAQQHQGDLELLEAVVRETADEVDWVFFGMCPQVLRPYVREIHNAVRFEDYPRKLASLDLDLAVAPLEHNIFNESKSNLRILEYGMLGWPVIASDIAPYRNAPVCRVINKPEAWIKAIREHIHDLDETARKGDALRNWVTSNWLLEHHLPEWMAVLDPDATLAEQRPNGRASA